jgi:hypothetical protein
MATRPVWVAARATAAPAAKRMDRVARDIWRLLAEIEGV